MKLDYYQLFECFSPEALAPREKPPFYDCIRDFATTLDAQSFTNFFNARFKWHWYPVGTVRLCSFPTNGDLVKALNEKQTLAAIGYAASMCAQENGKRFISALGLLSLLCQSIKQEQPVPALTQSFMAIRELVTRNAIDVNISFWFSKVALYQINTGVVPDGYGGTFDRAGLNAPTDDSTTPLHRAARDGHRDVSELLIAEGADVNAMDGGQQTPLDWAKIVGHTLADLLRKHGGKTKKELEAAGK